MKYTSTSISGECYIRIRFPFSLSVYISTCNIFFKHTHPREAYKSRGIGVFLWSSQAFFALFQPFALFLLLAAFHRCLIPDSFSRSGLGDWFQLGMTSRPAASSLLFSRELHSALIQWWITALLIHTAEKMWVREEDCKDIGEESRECIRMLRTSKKWTQPS